MQDHEYKNWAYAKQYLGIPFFVGTNKAELWNNLIEKCQKNMEGWRGKWLSLARQILMLQTVISAMLVFAMMCLDIPKKVVCILEQKMRNFSWNGSNEGDKIPLLAWENIYRSKDEGGVGIRNWQLMNKAMGEKLIWAMHEKP